MVRVVLDTNVVVSGIIKPDGAPGRVLELLISGVFELAQSPALVDDLRETLRKPRLRKFLRMSPAEADARIHQLAVLADTVDAGPVGEALLRDPDDAIVLGVAVEAHADCIVTGDEDVLVFGAFEGIPIVTPRQFLDLLNTAQLTPG